MKIKYNTSQINAIQYPDKPLLIIAGAGTGKTTTIVGRISYLIKKNNVSPDSILALTFSSTAALNLKEKLIAQIGLEADNVHACTFHSFAQSISMLYYNELGYINSPKIMNRGDIYYLLSSHLNELNIFKSKLFRRNPIEAIQSFQMIFNSLRQNLFSYNELEEIKIKILKNHKDEIDLNKKEIDCQLLDIIDAYPMYQRWKKNNNWIDYGDMIINLWELIENHPQALNYLQGKYRHIIVDEFQDNNYALCKIIERIAEPENSLTVVGDDDQCIYSFRQANIHNMKYFISHYFSKNQAPINLMQNYRSLQSILDLGNIVIANNTGRIIKGKLKSNISNTYIPKLYIGNNDNQLNKIGEKITQLIQDDVPPNKIAILTRTHSQCKKVVSHLNAIGIGTYYNSEKLYEQTVIKDIISILHLYAKSKKSNHALIRLLNKEATIDNVKELNIEYSSSLKSVSLYNYIINSNLPIKKYAENILKSIRKIKWQNISDLIYEIIKLKQFYREGGDHDSIEKKIIWQSLKQFQKLVNNFCLNYSKNDLELFIKFIDIQADINEEALDPILELYEIPVLKVMTVHSVKGMEFEHVLVPFLRSGSFPLHYRSKNMIDQLPLEFQRWDMKREDLKTLHYEEERRLFYVAITRAKKTLTLFAPLKRQSIFIKDISERYLEKESIMTVAKEKSPLDILSGKYQAKLQLEINMKHFDTANYLLEAIKNLSLIHKSKDIIWGDNPFRKDVESLLLNKDINISNNKPNLSATSIQTYDQCPLKYKYQYILGIPAALEKPYLSLGKVIHKVLELYHEKNFSTQDELINLLNSNWEDGGYVFNQEKDQCYEDAKEMLVNYWEYSSSKPAQHILTEHWFSFDTEYAKISGKCDRIDIHNNKISIIDYKTSKLKKTPSILKNDIQIGIYALFLYCKGLKISKDKFIKSIPEKLIMLFLREKDPEVSVEFTIDDLDKVQQKIKSTAENINKNIFEGNKGKHCDWCDYRSLVCPLFG